MFVHVCLCKTVCVCVCARMRERECVIKFLYLCPGFVMITHVGKRCLSAYCYDWQITRRIRSVSNEVLQTTPTC